MSTTFAPINRISHAKYDPNLAVTGDEQLSYYSYDIHGNVHTLVNDNRLLSSIQQNLKKNHLQIRLSQRQRKRSMVSKRAARPTWASVPV
jgi:predicted aminopeptidase